MRWICVFSLCVISLIASSQSIVKPRQLQVTINKTTNLIFPAEISSVDRGSERIVVQKATTNILRVKADSIFSDTTSLSVITSDGRLYSFLVSFHPSPDTLNVDLGVGDMLTKDTALSRLAGSVLSIKNNLYGLRYSDGNVQLQVVGIYIRRDQLVCKLRIENSSSLSFEVGKFRFHVSEKNAGTRRAVQEMEVMPLFVPVHAIAREKHSIVVVVVLPKIAVSRSKLLRIDLNEKGGERHLVLHVPAKYILHAAPIN